LTYQLEDINRPNKSDFGS